MSDRPRMSPFSALSFSIAFVLIAGIGMVTILGITGIQTINNGMNNGVAVMTGAIDNLPEFIDSLPPAIRDHLYDHRAPEYREFVELDVKLIPSEKHPTIKLPLLTAKNTGNEVITWLAVRVQVLNANGAPVSTWTEYVATPIAIENECPGPMLPDNDGRVSGVRHCQVYSEENQNVTVEIVELRVADKDVPPVKKNT